MFDQEALYVKQTRQFTQRIWQTEDPSVRISAKILFHFLKESIFGRRVEYEENVVKNTVQKSIRAFRKVLVFSANKEAEAIRAATKGYLAQRTKSQQPK